MVFPVVVICTSKYSDWSEDPHTGVKVLVNLLLPGEVSGEKNMAA